VPQPLDGITYAGKLQKSEAALDFSLPAAVLARRVRAFDPFPGATMVLPGFDQPVKVWAAHAVPSPDAGTGEAAGRAPGTVLRLGREGIDVATADGVLRVTALQKPGGRRQAVEVFLQSYRP
jgi:methionyl-tRNA formyltransferase